MWKTMRKLILDEESDEVEETITPRVKIDVIKEEYTTAKSSPLDLHRKCSPRQRTPMGSCVLQEGEKPLTSLGDSYPGPSDYQPKADITKQASPHYSIVGKPKLRNDKRDIPGPFNYDTSGDLTWKRKKISLKSRGKSYFDREAEKSISLLGKYKVEHHAVGTSGPKFKIGTRPGSRVYNGPANSLVKPEDTKGFYTPGPNYRPNSSYWGRGPKKSFGGRCKTKDLKGKVPGPADYDVQTTLSGPSHSFGIKLPEPVSVQQTVNKFSPAANTYDIGTTIGKSPAVVIGGRIDIPLSSAQVPCPTSYTPVYRCYNHKYRAVSLTYRWFDSDEESKKPGPADYKVRHPNLKNSPRYTCRQRVKTSYPDSVTYDKAAGDDPGPGSYCTARDFTDNGKPAYSFGKRIEPRSEKENVPGPNAYVPEKRDIPGSKKQPSFSMARRLLPPNSMKNNPGPGEYSLNPKLYESEKGKYTMTSRPRGKGANANPVAPNVYTLPELISGKKKGVALKSRASPFVYSGFRSERIEEPRTLPAIVN